MVLGGDVTLSKDILRQPTEFVKTWSQWAAQNRKEFTAAVGVTDITTKDFDTVDDGTTLYITSAYINIANSGAAGVFPMQASLTIRNAGGGVVSEFLSINCGSGGNNNISVTFPTPIRLDQGQFVRLQGFDLGTQASAGIFGWLEPTRIT